MTQRQALQIAGERLAGPILGAILTDVAGFGALCWASVAPVRDFGTMMVLGSLMVIPATCLLVPVLRSWVPAIRRRRGQVGAKCTSVIG